MTGQLLQRHDIHTAPVESNCERMPERVPVHVFKPSLAAGFLEPEPEILKLVSGFGIVET
jgi:hypothetical protein